LQKVLKLQKVRCCCNVYAHDRLSKVISTSNVNV